METKKRTAHKMDLLSAVEKVVELSKGSHLDAEFFKKAARPLKFISEKMELTKEQSVIMALFIDNSNDCNITICDFAKHLECSMTKIIRFMNDIDVLEQRGMIYCSRSGQEISYRVPWETINAFRKDEKFVPKSYFGLSCYELFGALEEIFQMREDNELTYNLTKQRILDLLNCNKHLIFVQKLKSYKLFEDDEILLVLFSHLFVNNSDDNIGYSDLKFLYDKRWMWNVPKVLLSNNTHILQEAQLVECVNEGGFANRKSFRMTMKAKQTLFSELTLASMDLDNSQCCNIQHNSITTKPLFFDKEVSAQVENLEQILEENNYKMVCERLKDKGYLSGFTCLFYGAPGTGKTETVLQLARKTGRDIVQVNIPEIKSSWVGESEKNIKRVFDQYRVMVEKMAVTPILLFNEADAIIGKRREGAERAVDKMENAIQNIILQEMETLDGILIATTNLVQNMDMAFERRFLYKIKFNKPSLEARMNIWHEKLPLLGEAVIRVLAEKYDFSGGQIENIARHHTIDGILNGEGSITLETLMAHCDNERLSQNNSSKIGFLK
jgi:DNA polymerase III delta prime subunit